CNDNVDECSASDKNDCASNTDCKDTDGSFIYGTCTCKDGWAGATCNDNVDECQQTTTCNSVPNSKCEDLQGSFNCKCNAGYVKVNDKCEGRLYFRS
ncbi:hypothetical protein LOTGIDRAFT_107831, partial [Lottia gigantea]